MPVQLDCKFRQIEKPTSIKELYCKNITLIVWWYCCIYKNTQEGTQPLVLVAFRKQIKDNLFSDEFVYRRISIALLGQVQIGSLCRDNKVFQRASFETRDFDLKYQKGGWWFRSFNRDQFNPFPLDIHPIPYARDKNWLVEFRAGDEERLVIPSLEYFTRCYGRSAELRRVLMTYPWSNPDGCLNRFFAPIDEPQDPRDRTWKIKLKKRMHNGDTVFLAHVKYDPYTLRVAKNVYSHIEAQFDGATDIPAFAKIGPWYTGSATLRVSGIPFNDGKSFLGLQILGSSEPRGEDIDRTRENRGDALNPAGPGADGNAWAGAPARVPRPRPEIVNLTSTEEPDNGAETLDVADPEFVILGTPRPVRTVRDQQAQNSGGPRGDGNNAENFSAGEPHGNGSGTGQASISTEIKLESEGALRDMWNAMLHMKVLHKDMVSCVEWFSPDKGFVANDDPELVALEPFKSGISPIEDEPLPPGVIRWPYMDNSEQSEHRGLLVARMRIQGRFIYIVEIQRRPVKRKGNNGEMEDAEESYQGLIFKLNSEDDFPDWLKKIRFRIRYVKGVVSRLVPYCPGKAGTFRHVPSSTDKVPCWAALINALTKVDIYVNQVETRKGRQHGE